MQSAGFAKWELYALRLRPYAGALFHNFHERPLELYRRLRGGHEIGMQKYQATWAFQNRQRLESLKYFLHGGWSVLLGAILLGGDAFDCVPAGEEILGRDLLLLASR